MDPRLLICAVLDGEATPEETRELERLLAKDEVAAAEYEALRHFLALIDRVPPLDPPADLADLAAPHLRTRKSPGIPAAKGVAMNQKVSKRTLWIGTGGVLAAAVIVALFAIPFPPGGKETSGTVVPAQRYRAEQIQAKDVQLGDQAVTQLMQSEVFDRMVKDPQIRALALDPDFQALARSHQLDAMLKNADAVVARAKALSAASESAAARSNLAAGQSAAAQSAAAQSAAAQSAAARSNLAASQSAAARSNLAAGQSAAAQSAAAQSAAAQSAASQSVAANLAAANMAAATSASSRAEAMLSAQAAALLARHPDAFVRFAQQADFAALASNAAFADALAAAASAKAMAQ